jgi:deoxyribodipyrimidine photo-lyase
MPPYIHWFRRDLRLHDNPALMAAARASGGQVVPLFILDDAVLAAPRTGAARVAFMLDSLRALDAALRERGSRLIVRRGPPDAKLRALATECGAAGVTWNRDYTPYAIARDNAAGEALHGLDVRTFAEAMILEPREVLTKAGKPYTVYTPYRRNWRVRVEALRDELLVEDAIPSLVAVPETIVSLPLPTAADLGFATTQLLPTGGEAAGRARLADFVRANGEIDGYAAGRDQPGLPATSRLSPYLRFGCVAARACARAALNLMIDSRLQSANDHKEQSAIRNLESAIETWLSELAWRDFYYQILANFPYVLRGAFKRQYDGLEWENDERLFAAWCAGQTGYPIVDAAIRQLNSEAWMHNRARMIVASFLTKDLLIDWRWGERYFMRQLVDGDHAANNGGWQWAAGTGTDAQPYFRIFNPTSQGQKFDPRGIYIRRYVPELERVPDRYINTPWAMPIAEQRRAGVLLGRDYPMPIVDHAERRTRALALYRSQKTARDV